MTCESPISKRIHPAHFAESRVADRRALSTSQRTIPITISAIAMICGLRNADSAFD